MSPQSTLFVHFFYSASFLQLANFFGALGMVVQGAGHRTCGQEVAGSTPSRGAAE